MKVPQNMGLAVAVDGTSSELRPTFPDLPYRFFVVTNVRGLFATLWPWIAGVGVFLVLSLVADAAGVNDSEAAFMVKVIAGIGVGAYLKKRRLDSSP